MDWDVFISHAWEDKESFARPLAKALEAEGLRVWFDEFTLRVGDRLRRSIDHGLANSRYGIVILSPHFFAKEWPQKELDGLAVREVSGGKVILPVWHNITADQVRRYSPTLADRVAVSSSHGLEYVVMEDIPEAARDAARSAVADGYYWWDDAAFKYYDYDSILSEITRAIEVSPEQADYYWMRGVNYHTAAFHGHPSGDYDWAIADYTRAIALDPQKADYYRSRGASYHNKGDYDRAIADKTRAIELDPGNGQYYYFRGLSYELRGNQEAARRDFQRAAELGHVEPNQNW